MRPRINAYEFNKNEFEFLYAPKNEWYFTLKGLWYMTLGVLSFLLFLFCVFSFYLILFQMYNTCVECETRGRNGLLQ